MTDMNVQKATEPFEHEMANAGQWPIVVFTGSGGKETQQAIKPPNPSRPNAYPSPSTVTAAQNASAT